MERAVHGGACLGGRRGRGDEPRRGRERGLAGHPEAARTADFARLPGMAERRIADLSRPLADPDIDPDNGGDGIPLQWTGMGPAGGGFAKGTAGEDRVDGEMHRAAHGGAGACSTPAHGSRGCALIG